ncbi:hypothetical protein [Saccharothrix sp. HUAS TT1]|uniref:hypothetical protein n=1 Tax=unclassified Saccharothrix TaxID=2593673 RepID=UPI00345B61A3
MDAVPPPHPDLVAEEIVDQNAADAGELLVLRDYRTLDGLSTRVVVERDPAPLRPCARAESHLRLPGGELVPLAQDPGTDELAVLPEDPQLVVPRMRELADRLRAAALHVLDETNEGVVRDELHHRPGNPVQQLVRYRRTGGVLRRVTVSRSGNRFNPDPCRTVVEEFGADRRWSTLHRMIGLTGWHARTVDHAETNRQLLAGIADRVHDETVAR